MLVQTGDDDAFAIIPNFSDETSQKGCVTMLLRVGEALDFGLMDQFQTRLRSLHGLCDKSADILGTQEDELTHFTSFRGIVPIC